MISSFTHSQKFNIYIKGMLKCVPTEKKMRILFFVQAVYKRGTKAEKILLDDYNGL